MESDDYHFKFRIVLLGEKSVGKSTFLDVLANTFGKIVEQEQSDELNLKTVGYMDDDTLYKIAYWEIPGKHRSPDTFFRFCLGATAAIYMFDVSKRQTFEKIEHWITENEKTEIPVKILIGNKIDLFAANKGGVSKSEAIGMARKYGMEYFEVCSIGEPSIAPVFDFLFSTIIGQIPNPPTPLALMGKGILIGKRLLNSAKYQLVNINAYIRHYVTQPHYMNDISINYNKSSKYIFRLQILKQLVYKEIIFIQMDMDDCPILKIILIGAESVGKTRILHQYTDQQISTTQPTIGIDFFMRSIHILDRTVKLQIWDTSGQEQYKHMTETCYSDSKGAIIVYNITNKSSIQSVQEKIQLLKQKVPDCVLMLVGNQLDLVENDPTLRAVSINEAQNIASMNEIIFTEVSTMDAYKIAQIFTQLATQIILNMENQIILKEQQIPEDDTN